MNRTHFVIMRLLSHITPNGTTAINAAECIYKNLIEDDIDISKMQCIGSDGTRFNTGHLTGEDSSQE